MSRIIQTAIQTQILLALLLTAGLMFSMTASAGEPAETASEEETAVVEESKGDVLVIEEESAAEDDTSATPKMVRKPDFPTPARGMSMAGVRDAFGEPNTEHPAVGEPPITRWDYDRFSVFFEHDKVLHSVALE